MALPPLAQTMVGLALLTGLRRGELFALPWKSVSLDEGHLTVDEAVHEGAFGTPKTSAGLRRVPLSEATVRLVTEWKERATKRPLVHDRFSSAKAMAQIVTAIDETTRVRSRSPRQDTPAPGPDYPYFLTDPRR